MAYSKSNHRDSILRWIDATSGQRWTVDATTGEVDRRMGIAFDREWKRILNAQRYYRINKRTPISGSDGKYLISDLSDNTVADAKKRMYRILAVAVDNVVYKEQQFVDNVLADTQQPYSNVWWYEGDRIACVPIQAAKTATGIWVNYIPTRPDLLSGESVLVDFPDGYEDILDLEAAALLLSKGGAETSAANELRGLAEDMRQDMLQDIARISTNPMVMRYDDTAAEWAG